MEAARLVERIQSVDIDIDNASAAGITALLGDVLKLRGFTSTIEAHAARRLQALEADGSGLPAADALARANKTGQKSAERASRRAGALGNTPEVEKKLGAGKISDEHADALANAAAKLDNDDQRDALFALDSESAERAAGSTPAGFARFLNRKARELSADDGVERSEQQRKDATISYGIDDETGMGYLRSELHPDDFQKLKRSFEAEIEVLQGLPENEGLDHGQLAAKPLVALVTGGRAKASPPPEVLVLIDLKSITPSCWVPTDSPSTSVADHATQHLPNPERRVRCTAPAPSTAATPPSTAVKSTTASNGPTCSV